MVGRQAVILAASSSSISIVSFIGSSFIFLVILFRKEGSLRTPSNLLIANLAMADLLKSVPGTVPLYTLRVLGHSLNFHECIFSLAWSTIMICAAAITHMALTIERLMAIESPFLYIKWFEKRAVVGIISAIWVFAVTVWGILPFIWNKGLDRVDYCTWVFVATKEQIISLNMVIGLFIPLAVITVAYIRITIIALRHLTRMNRQVHPLPDQPTAPDPVLGLSNTLMKSELKTTFRCMIVVLVFVLCQLPQRIVTLMVLTGHKLNFPPNAIVSLFTVQAFLSPLLYGFTSKEVRKEITVIFKSWYSRCWNRESTD